MTTRAPLALALTAAAALSGCVSGGGGGAGSAAFSDAAYDLSTKLAANIGQCWFAAGETAFDGYVYTPERNAGVSRILLVRKADPRGLPALVIDATSGGPKKTEKKQVDKDTEPAGTGEILEGRAVWYGKDWHGKPTASGEKFDRHALTAAHRTLPLGTKVRVTNTRNGKSVVVRINDRGPYGKDRRRIIDLSEAAAKILDYIDAGWTTVTIEVLERPAKKARRGK